MTTSTQQHPTGGVVGDFTDEGWYAQVAPNLPASAPIVRPLGRLLAPLYATAIRRRNRRFDAGDRVVRFDVPVISIGNLSVGGTGKTPMVHGVVERLRDMGERPCIAMRGYRPRSAPADAPSDEEREYRDRFEGIAIVAQPDRTAGLRQLFGAAAPDERPTCIVLDDGFQHRFIHRDANVVLVDATRDPFGDHVLPGGWLREPVESLRRATHVVLTHADLVTDEVGRELRTRIRAVAPETTIGAARHAWIGVRIHNPMAAGSDQDRSDEAGWLHGKRVVAACAIGNPWAFLLQVRQATGVELAGAMVLRDHHHYPASTVSRLERLVAESGAEGIVTTGKDWTKLRSADIRSLGAPIVRPRLRLSFEDSEGVDIVGRIIEDVGLPSHHPPD